MQELMSPETVARVREIRSRLPGQMLQERLQNAQLTYGPLYTLAEVRQRRAPPPHLTVPSPVS